MSQRVTFDLTLELLSDTIFGSGYSIPGGEDIAVCQDEAGYPYLQGSTLKGLLRESLANLLVWTGGEESTMDALMGREGWEHTADDRRVQLTDLTLQDKPAAPEDCTSLRTFTEIENGTVKEGSLRTASCVRRGLRFAGLLCCAKEDEKLVRQALAGIQWAGTMRSRGFGHIRVTMKEAPAGSSNRSAVKEARCLFYRLKTESPVVITNHSRSSGNSHETCGYITGSAVRGMVINELARRDPAWFEAHKAALLSEQTRFLDAFPADPEGKGLPSIPSVMGYYEDKEEEHFESIVVQGDFTPGYKRAKIGSFCALDGDALWFWSASTSGATRIQRPKGKNDTPEMFQTRYLEPGQIFEGYILLDQPELAGAVAGILSDTVWLGADRYGGFGRCSVLDCRAAEHPAWLDVYGQDKPGRDLYMLALSPLAMLDETGDIRGLDTKQLADALGVGKVKIEQCSTSVAEYGGFNRTWASRVPAARMYERGSLFLLQCDTAPSAEALEQVERQGLGIRRSEGFGQVLFLKNALLEGITHKQACQRPASDTQRKASALRRERIDWIQKRVETVQKAGVSPSQLGDIQAQCEWALAQDDTSQLFAYLDHNLKERGAKHAAKFKKIDRLLHEELDNTDGAEQIKTLQRLCDLFDYVRKLPKTNRQEAEG